ncbi:hypothetical protein [Burkholderia sp. LMG 32019]|uniref:hypothetical protein n=1 Tax=Burkholderia sp. LMG 32019 TaxID=3158173 RepID=UPI003C2FF92F
MESAERRRSLHAFGHAGFERGRYKQAPEARYHSLLGIEHGKFDEGRDAHVAAYRNGIEWRDRVVQWADIVT